MANLDEILHVIDSRFELAREMSKDVDFLHVTIFYINVLHHFFYDEEPTKQGWKIIDKNLGRFIQDGCNIILMSDHGIHKVDTVFYINSWLEKEGYLKIKRPPLQKYLRKAGITREKLTRIVVALKLRDLVRKVIPSRVKKALPYQSGTMAGETGIPEEAIIWDESKVLGTGQGTVYLLIPEESNEYEELKEELIKKLEELVIRENGRKVASKVYKKEEYYSGEFLDIAPDIVYEQGRHVYTTPGLGRKEYFDVSHKWKAENLIEGIFLAYGDNIKKGSRLKNIKIV